MMLSLALLMGASLMLARQARAADEGLTVAVFDFKVKDPEQQKMGALLADLARVQLTTNPKLRLVERQELDKILGEQKMTMAGLTEEAAAKAGRMLGAQVLVVGNLFELNGKLIATTKVIGVETSRVYAETASGEAADLPKIGMEIGTKVAGLIEKGADTLVAKVKLTSDQIAEMKKALAGKKLPRVFVFIRERAITAPAPDAPLSGTRHPAPGTRPLIPDTRHPAPARRQP